MTAGVASVRERRRRGSWWAGSLATIVAVLAAQPLLAPMDARALNFLQAAWPGRPPADVAAVVFNGRDVVHLTAMQGWPDALGTLLRRLQAADARAVWLQLPVELAAAEHAALRDAAGRLPLYFDLLGGVVRPEGPALTNYAGLAAGPGLERLGNRIRIVGEGSAAVRVPLGFSRDDGPLLPSTAWLVATGSSALPSEPGLGSWAARQSPLGGDGPAPAPKRNEPRGAQDRPLPSHVGDKLWHVVVPRLGPPDTLSLLDGMQLVLGGEADGLQLAGKTVVVGVDEAGSRVRLPGHGTVAMSEPEFWARTVSALARGELVGWLTPPTANLSVALLLLMAAGLVARGPAVRALRGTAALSAGSAAAWLATYAFAGVFVPPTAFCVGMLMLCGGWAVSRQLRSGQYFRRQLSTLRWQLQHDETAVPVSDNADPIGVVEAAVAQLQAQRLFMLDLLDSLPIGVLAADPRGAVQLANRRARDWLALPGHADLRSLPLRQVLSGMRQRGGGTPPGPLSRRDASFEAETADHRPVWVQTRHIGGRLPSIVVVVDMTAFRAAAAARQEALDFLSHDMRAPLSSIAAIVDTPLPDHGTVTVERTLRQIGRLANRTLELANAFLAFVRADEVDPVGFEAVFLPDVLESLADEVAPRALGAGCRLDVDIGAEPVWVQGDASLLTRAVRNLLDNALRHGRGQPVRLRLRRSDGSAEVTVHDLGPGFQPAAALPPHGPELAEAGLPQFGLGLRFVRRVAALHGGSLELADHMHGGGLATLCLPCMSDTALHNAPRGTTVGDN